MHGTSEVAGRDLAVLVSWRWAKREEFSKALKEQSRERELTINVAELVLEALKLLGSEDGPGENLVLDLEVQLMPAVPYIVELQLADPSLAQSHRVKKFGGVLELRLLLLAGPAKLASHDVDHARESLESGFGIEEGEASAASDDVHGGTGVLATASPGDLGVDVGVGNVEALAVDGPAKSGRLRHRADGPGAVTVGIGEMLGDIGLCAR